VTVYCLPPDLDFGGRKAGNSRANIAKNTASRYDGKDKKRCGDSDEQGRLYLCNRHELERLSRIRRYRKGQK
jgi:hypothetical protein